MDISTKRKFNFLVQNYCYYYYSVNHIYLSQLNITNFEVNLKNYNNFFLMVLQIYFIFCKCPNTFGGGRMCRYVKGKVDDWKIGRNLNLREAIFFFFFYCFGGGNDPSKKSTFPYWHREI